MMDTEYVCVCVCLQIYYEDHITFKQKIMQKSEGLSIFHTKDHKLPRNNRKSLGTRHTVK